MPLLPQQQSIIDGAPYKPCTNSFQESTKHICHHTFGPLSYWLSFFQGSVPPPPGFVWVYKALEPDQLPGAWFGSDFWPRRHKGAEAHGEAVGQKTGLGTESDEPRRRDAACEARWPRGKPKKDAGKRLEARSDLWKNNLVRSLGPFWKICSKHAGPKIPKAPNYSQEMRPALAATQTVAPAPRCGQRGRRGVLHRTGPFGDLVKKTRSKRSWFLVGSRGSSVELGLPHLSLKVKGPPR